jgi:DNA-binding Lrp family transcriptional regulator
MNSSQPELDLIDCKLLGELQANARISFADLSRKVSLSTPAVTERVKRLEERGVIVGFHAQVYPPAVGRSVREGECCWRQVIEICADREEGRRSIGVLQNHRSGIVSGIGGCSGHEPPSGCH